MSKILLIFALILFCVILNIKCVYKKFIWLFSGIYYPLFWAGSKKPAFSIQNSKLEITRHPELVSGSPAIKGDAETSSGWRNVIKIISENLCNHINHISDNF